MKHPDCIDWIFKTKWNIHAAPQPCYSRIVRMIMLYFPLCSHFISVDWTIGLLPVTQDCGLCMRRECRGRFPRHRIQRKPRVSDPDMHHGTCVTHMPWCMSGLLSRGSGENVPGIPGACATRNFAYLVRGPLDMYSFHIIRFGNSRLYYVTDLA